ncbi:RagB/SusD family nutrient uptake outer membrane protein [Chitinophaga nivalis]|uniref:RagB/SusD family nutrient uptake outer membrane protein n=1 Tax=Chitinophaga nivalis TaxID=2991709 RepID=A0ABT3ITB7_9BACT|nr:RagB/SusD family nutrient uptake outer membrane protein [Chitinophaga nivalis]MCW3463088.1 RagB/SusD family nutrient uptake outer membrane protein [Chitinophaga nivalis]MCW3487222.1 RagB/SusD family nutrient uptake outer membrane protein [Chitinophaga nivalis]
MKKIYLGLLLLALAGTGCNKMLEEDVVTNTTDDFYYTKNGFMTAVNAGYTGMRSFYSTERGMTLTVVGTDTYTNGSDGNFKFANQYTSQLDSRYDHIRELWNGLYQAINNCNVAIDRADQVKELDAVSKRSGVAESRFNRAHYHFLLMQLFGSIPLRLHENKEILTTAQRDSTGTVYDAIITDLKAAAQELPASQNDWGRATRPAAEHLLARVYLTRASSPDAKPEDYADAARYADMVIRNYGFKLLDDPGQVWAQGNERNTETIFAAQYTTDPLYASPDNNACRFFLMQYDVLDGMQRDLANGTPWKRFRPTKFLLDTLYKDRVHDVRYEKFFTTVWFVNKAITKPRVMNIGDTSVWMPGYAVAPEVVAGKNYLLVPPADYTEKLYPSLNKFQDALRPDNQASGVRPFIAFRLAETYLIAAEARMMTGDRTGAADMINKVRLRAARPGKTPEETAANEAAMRAMAGDLNIDFILDERGRELIGEQLAWFDLKRTGKLLERVRKHNPQAAANIEPKHLLRPIPQDQIDRSSNIFRQNPGY